MQQWQPRLFLVSVVSILTTILILQGRIPPAHAGVAPQTTVTTTAAGTATATNMPSGTATPSATPMSTPSATPTRLPSAQAVYLPLVFKNATGPTLTPTVQPTLTPTTQPTPTPTVLVPCASTMDFPNLVTPVAASPHTWTSTGCMAQPRAGHTATLLANGTVLVAAGNDTTNTALASAELYDPVRGTWTPTGSLHTARGGHTATLLANGKVLVAGGNDTTNTALASAELYDPVRGTWTATGPMSYARSFHTATLLANGTVLVASGGGAGLTFLTSAELYHPTTGTWTRTGSLTTGRTAPTATLLRTGQVLVAGGYTDIFNDVTGAAELYNPTTGTWTTTGSMATNRGGHTATLLASGQVLVTGGQYPDQFFNLWIVTATSELYDPTHGTWTVTRNMPGARSGHTATLLASGQVLVTGGQYPDYLNSNWRAIATAEFYTTAQLTWTPTDSLHTARSGHTATLLTNGTVLVAGGGDTNGHPLASAEVYSP